MRMSAMARELAFQRRAEAMRRVTNIYWSMRYGGMLPYGQRRAARRPPVRRPRYSRTNWSRYRGGRYR